MKVVSKILFYTYLSLCFLISCNEQEIDPQFYDNAKKEINEMVDKWHSAAANADTSYFDYIAPDAIYIGTDATERWTKEELKAYSMPYFEKGKAWTFKPLERHIYFLDNCRIAYFDEALISWMGIGRSTGVVVMNENNKWLIKYYHLSIAIPNEKAGEVVKIISNDLK